MQRTEATWKCKEGNVLAGEVGVEFQVPTHRRQLLERLLAAEDRASSAAELPPNPLLAA